MTRNTLQIFKDKKPSLPKKNKKIQDKKASYEGKLQAY